jgi:kynureninase
MPALRAKSESLTGYLEQLIDADLRDVLQVVTPRDSMRDAVASCRFASSVDANADATCSSSWHRAACSAIGANRT